MDMAGRGCDGAFAAFVRPFKSDERIFSQRAFTSRRLDTHYSRGNHNIGDSRHGKKHYIENEKRGGLNPTFALGRENRGERGREFFDEFRDPDAKFGFNTTRYISFCRSSVTTVPPAAAASFLESAAGEAAVAMSRSLLGRPSRASRSHPPTI